MTWFSVLGLFLMIVAPRLAARRAMVRGWGNRRINLWASNSASAVWAQTVSTANAGHTFSSFTNLAFQTLQGVYTGNWYTASAGGVYPWRSDGSNMFISTITANSWYQQGQAYTC